MSTTEKQPAYSLDTLIDEARQDLELWFEDHANIEADDAESDAQQAAEEIAEQAVPIHYADIFQYALMEPAIQFHRFDDMGIIPDDADVSQIVQIAIFEEIRDTLDGRIREWIEQREEED